MEYDTHAPTADAIEAANRRRLEAGRHMVKLLENRALGEDNSGELQDARDAVHQAEYDALQLDPDESHFLNMTSSGDTEE